MDKKGLKILGIVAILLCIVWCGYKVFLLSYYRHNDQSHVKERLENAKDISITSNKSLANTQFINMNLYIPDEYKEYKPSQFKEQEGEFYQKMYSSDNENVDIWLQKESSTIDDLLSSLNFDAKKLMKKYNISDEIDFYRYLKNQKSTKRNIFWSKSRLQMDYLVSLYLETNLSDKEKSEDYNFITSDLNGMMTTGNSYILIRLLNGNERYELRFAKNTFTKEQVEDMLKSVYFN